MLRTKVKASAITNLTDARYFAAREVTWLGFCLDPADENYITPQEVLAIKEWVDGPLIVGEFNLQTTDEITAAIGLLNLDVIQAGMFTSFETLESLFAAHPDLTVIKEFVIEPTTPAEALREQLKSYSHLTSKFILNFDKNGIPWSALEKGQPFSLAFLSALCRQYEILLSIDLSPAGAGVILSTLDPAGLNVRGGLEEKVGFKSFDELDGLFDVLEL